MQHYPNDYTFQEALWAHVKKELGLTEQEDLDQMTQARWGAVFNFEVSTYEGLVGLDLCVRLKGQRGATFWHPSQVNIEEAQEVTEALKTFQGSYRAAHGIQRFYGFGVGIDPEFDRRISEIAGCSGKFTYRGSTFQLSTLYIIVPHPFFQRLGYTCSLTYRAKTLPGVAEARDHWSNVRRELDLAQLIERTFLTETPT